jgi:signal peptidase II
MTKRFLLFAVFALTITGCDQVTKLQAVAHLAHGATVTVHPDFWRFLYVENPGAAFSMLHDAAEPWRTMFLVAFGAVALVLIVTMLVRAKNSWQASALALILGGALGNFVDRVRLGYVIDFIQWHWYDRASWPVFNLADAALSIGIVMLLIEPRLRTKLQRQPVQP